MVCYIRVSRQNSARISVFDIAIIIIISMHRALVDLYITRCCAVRCCAVRCCAVLCCAVRCCAVRCGAVLCFRNYVLLFYFFIFKKVRKTMRIFSSFLVTDNNINPLNAELNPICCMLALLGAHHFLRVSRIRVKSLTLRLLMSYIDIWSTHS